MAVQDTNQANPSSGLMALLSPLERLKSLTPIVMPVGLLLILFLLLIPLPTWLLDFSLTVSITVSVMVLMVVILLNSPLELTSFPTILLIVTMFRLGLNVASTRLILTDGHEGTDAAGRVIEAFGGFISGGNYVTGIIIFGILVIINFIVITRGAGRIAEVSARFTLDALPGKQIAIDSDLSAGLVDEDGARSRRRELEVESGFYGAMDGASKFVRGDAIAGLLITFINIVAGIIIGVVQRDLSLAESSANYTLLTIGDGLVTQIPALVVSTAAGLLATKGSSRETTQTAVIGQLGKQPFAMYIVSGLLLIMMLIPGIPILPFLLLSLLMAGTGYYVQSRARLEKETEMLEKASKAESTATDDEAPVEKSLEIDLLRLELGYGLLNLVNDEEKTRLPLQIRAMRRQIASDYGFVMPALRIQDNLQLPSHSYVISVKEIESGRGDLRSSNMVLVMSSDGKEIELKGEETKDPIFGLNAKWIHESERGEAMFRGYTVVDSETIITTHITEIVKDNMAELLSYAETRKLLDALQENEKKLVEDLIPSQISASHVQRILQTLLSEKVSIRDLSSILEAISEAVSTTRNITLLVEHVRSRLARQICDSNNDNRGELLLVTLTPLWDQRFAESLKGTGEEKKLAMPPSQLHEFVNQLSQVFEQQAQQGNVPILVTPPVLRPYIRSIIERFRPQTVVLSQAEIHPRAKIRTVAQI